MKKVNILWIILDLIFLMVFNVIFFMLGGFKHPASVWVSCGFIHFAYLMLLITPKLMKQGKNAAIFGFSLYAISSVYFLLEFIAGTVFILTALESYKVLLSVQIITTALYGILLIANLLANEYTAEAVEKRQSQIEYIKNASSRLKILIERISNKEAKKKVEQVYDAVYSSPVKSHPNLAQIENHILQSINEIENAASRGDNTLIISLAVSLLKSVNERNTILKTISSTTAF